MWWCHRLLLPWAILSHWRESRWIPRSRLRWDLRQCSVSFEGCPVWIRKMGLIDGGLVIGEWFSCDNRNGGRKDFEYYLFCWKQKQVHINRILYILKTITMKWECFELRMIELILNYYLTNLNHELFYMASYSSCCISEKNGHFTKFKFNDDLKTGDDILKSRFCYLPVPY